MDEEWTVTHQQKRRPSSTSFWNKRRHSSADTYLSDDAFTNVASETYRDFYAFNILAMIFCCLPVGALAVMHSVRCRNAFKKGDTEAGIEHSRRSQLWLFYTVMSGIIFYTASAFIAALLVVGLWPTSSE